MPIFLCLNTYYAYFKTQGDPHIMQLLFSRKKERKEKLLIKFGSFNIHDNFIRLVFNFMIFAQITISYDRYIFSVSDIGILGKRI